MCMDFNKYIDIPVQKYTNKTSKQSLLLSIFTFFTIFLHFIHHSLTIMLSCVKLTLPNKNDFIVDRLKTQLYWHHVSSNISSRSVFGFKPYREPTAA